ncbi:MAG: T9SS type A sorting domain-containing protein, partial [Chitinophagales bacterium]
ALQSGGKIDLNVKTKHINCGGNANLQLLSTYTCNEYPLEFDEVICPTNDRIVSIETPPAEVQMQVNGPSELLPLCESFDYEFIINSAQLANIYEPILNIEFPPLDGLSLAGSPTIEYPIGTGERPFTFTTTPTGLQVDLAVADLETAPSANILENGIAGLGIGNSDTRKAIIRVPLITDCNFISGSSIRATITANRPCGNPAVGSGISQLLEPILIEGAIPSYITLTTIDSDAVSYCDANSTVRVQIINEGPAATSADEHCYIFMPEGVNYLVGSTQSLNENTVAEPLQIDQFPFIQLDFTMPKGVADKDTIVFTFDVNSSELAACQDAFVEFIAQTIEFVPLFCASEGAECNLPVKTSEGTGYFDITIGGPEMNLSAIAQTGCAPAENGELTVNVTLFNSGNKAVTTNNTSVDVYLDLNGNGVVDATDMFLESLVYDSPIEVDEGVSLEGTWTIDPNLLSPLIFVLEAETYCNGCEDVIFYIPEVNAISALSLDYDVDCDDETELYTAFVYILNGVSPYSITGSTSANLNIDNFLIPNIPYGVPLEFFIEDGVGCKDTIIISDVCGVTLPVELLYFEGKTIQEGNLLQWQTASELNNDYFTLKRSIDGEIFETIATVKGQGTTSILQNYDFLDTSFPNGIVYYQLSQIDLNNKTRKLKTISLERKNTSTRLMIESIQPIPAKDFFNLQCFSPVSQSLELQVFDIYSKPIHRQSLTANIGRNHWRMDCSDWGKGVYILQLKGGEETVLKKIVLQ